MLPTQVQNSYQEGHIDLPLCPKPLYTIKLKRVQLKLLGRPTIHLFFTLFRTGLDPENPNQTLEEPLELRFDLYRVRLSR